MILKKPVAFLFHARLPHGPQTCTPHGVRLKMWRAGLVCRGRAALDKTQVLEPLLNRLNTVSGIDEADVAAIRPLPITIRKCEAGRAIVFDGDRPTESCLLIEGFCVRSKTIGNGQRQILSIHIPGEIPDLQSLYLHRMDHDLITLVPSILGSSATAHCVLWFAPGRTSPKYFGAIR